MGYFSNGSEGEYYRARFCARCTHGPAPDENPDDPPPGCSVWLLHLLFNGGDDVAVEMLDTLIPRAKDGLGNEQCTMFVERPS